MLSALEYHRPASLDEAFGLLERLGDDALPLAGGTDVIVDLKRGLKRARHVVSLRDIDELRGIRKEDERLWLGALVTPAEIAASDVIGAHRPELLDAVRIFGGPQVRNRATVGGNFCSAASCGDLPPLLMALGARAHVVGPKGARAIPLESFFVDARETVLETAEILTSIEVGARSPGEGACYETFGRRAAGFITVAGVAAAVRLEQGVCAQARIVLGAVAATPLLVPAAGDLLAARSLQDDEAIAEAAAAARKAAQPISDVRGTAAYRSEVVEVLTARALRAARERAEA